MPMKRVRKSSNVRARRPTGKKRKPVRRTTTFKSASWYQAAARMIRISDGIIAQGQ